MTAVTIAALLLEPQLLTVDASFALVSMDTLLGGLVTDRLLAARREYACDLFGVPLQGVFLLMTQQLHRDRTLENAGFLENKYLVSFMWWRYVCSSFLALSTWRL